MATPRGAEREPGLDPPSGASGRFAGGAVGWFGYEARGTQLGIPAGRGAPDTQSRWLWADRVLEFDHDRRELWLVARGERWGEAERNWAERVEHALGGAMSPSVHPAVHAIATASWSYSDAEYERMILSCQRRIAAGDAYQLCLTNEAAVEGDFDDVATHLALRGANPSPYGALIRIDGVSLVSSSPELFLSAGEGGAVESRPIKGTRRRGRDEAEDAALRRELGSDEKELAENLMIVDLVRNDLSRVSELGSVLVARLLEVETQPNVHQLVSTVRSRLAAGRTALDAIESCFPAGSMTGAPKSSALAILDSLEQRPRGVYSGAAGYLGDDGRVELAMVIRCIVIEPGRATVGAGGGITALSVPSAELAEVKLKAAPLLAALGVPAAPTLAPARN